MIKNQTIQRLLKNHKAILAIIVAGFFLRELSLVAIVPLFDGQDEPRHYNTIQIANETPPRDLTIINEPKEVKEKGLFETYNFSEEIRETARLAQTKQTPRKYYLKKEFSDSSVGPNEEKINSLTGLAYNQYYPQDAIEGTHLYHSLLSNIEHLFENKSILHRFFSARAFSALLGSFTILLTFFIAKNIGFTEKESLLLTALISFHPKLSLYLTNVNYDALIISIFTAFTLAAILNIKHGPNWKNMGALFAISILGFMTKGTSIILFAIIGALLAFHVFRATNWNKVNKKRLLSLLLLLLALIVSILVDGFQKQLLSFDFPLFFEYLSKSLPKIPSSLQNFWGDLDWIRNDFSEFFIALIWLAEITAYAGIALFFANKRKVDFAPKKEYILFLLLMIISLQAGIRFYDWRIFALTNSLDLGTPGRYFLPTIVPHITLICAGLGIMLKKRKYFEHALLAGLVLMFVFFSHSVLNSVIPNFYF